MKHTTSLFNRLPARLPTTLNRPFRLLALESSADDSCAAIVDSERKVWSNVVVKQHLIHEKFGGIHPIKSQDAHARNIPIAIETALEEAKLKPEDIDAYAYTRGPGMYGCLSCGSHAAGAMAAMWRKPIVGVHHMQAHALTPLLTEQTPPEFPFLNLLVSGGHTMLVLAVSEVKFVILAKSLDDSIGDAFDKTAKLLQIPWLPGIGPGASLEAYAAPHPTNTDLNTRVETLLSEIKPFKPSAAKQRAFSFAGLKTQVMKETQKRHPNLQLKGKLGISEVVQRAVGRRFQQAAVRQVEEKVRIVLDYLEKDSEGRKLLPAGEKVRALVASGGVASNQYLRTRSKLLMEERNPGQPIPVVFPPVALCTDNAAMIAWAGILKLRRQGGLGDAYGQLLKPKWSMEAIEQDEKAGQEGEEDVPPAEVTVVRV